jgi:ribulose kinase
MTTASNDVPVVIALDIGSSSIRCSAYRVLGKDGVKMLDQCYTVRQLKTVESISGKIRLTTEQGTDLLDEIDGIVDDVLQKLRELAEPTKVLGLGFASFCMNLIALDALGHPVGQEATISYSCSTSDVGDECRWLKR